jgi:hypothetical protein
MFARVHSPDRTCAGEMPFIVMARARRWIDTARASKLDMINVPLWCNVIKYNCKRWHIDRLAGNIHDNMGSGIVCSASEL